MRQNLQRGFVQNFILPGIVVLGVVIAGIAWLSGTASTGTAPDQENMNAMVVLAQGVKLQAALERATADGVITRGATGVIDLEATLQQSPFMPKASFPVPPAAALAVPSAWGYAQRHLRAFDAQTTPQPVGTDAPDDVIYLANLTAGVCAGINFRLFGTSTVREADGSYATEGRLSLNDGVVEGARGKVPASAASAAREGCVVSGSSYAYYKVVGVH